MLKYFAVGALSVATTWVTAQEIPSDEEGFAKAVLAAYQARFGAPPATLVAAVGKASDLAELQRWLEKVTTLSREEVTAALRASSTRKRAAPKKARRATSAPRRASAASSR